MRILIAMPIWREFIPHETAVSVFNMNRGEHEVELFVPQGFMTFEARNIALLYAKAHKFDAILWIDSDIIVPRNTLLQLLKHIDKYEIISGVYYRREHPCYPMVFELKEGEFNFLPALPVKSLIEVDGIGFGCVLTLISAFTEDEPFGFQKIGKFYQSEDLYFCSKYKIVVGKKIAVDTSIRCGHLTSTIITEKDWLKFKPNKNYIVNELMNLKRE